MANFNESNLEEVIIGLFQENGYLYVSGAELHRKKTDLLILKDFEEYIFSRYYEFNITNDEVQSILNHISHIMKFPLYEANSKFNDILINGFIFKRLNKDDKDFHFRLIDNETIDNNVFKIVNQLEISGYETRIPDAIIYVNGFPLVVLEFKNSINENTTIRNAYDQLTNRYRRGIPELFKYNAFVVISDGINNKYGSFFSDYDYFYSWRRIDKDDVDSDGIDSLITMINGLFSKDRLIDVISNFIFVPDNSNQELKVVCRYPQYYSAKSIHENVKKELKPNGSGKGGTYFGATGCGKSISMLYLARLLMKDIDLKSPTIILITDRNDLDLQLSSLFLNAKSFIGDENVQCVESRKSLKDELTDKASGGIYLTTIQKFCEDTELLSTRNNIVCISDEAHRSQLNKTAKNKQTEDGIKKTYGFAKYLHDALPNATFVGFTGTPIDATLDVFGAVVDSYTMSESVKDGITVNIVYEGRATKVLLDENKLDEINSYYESCFNEGATELQIDESKKAVSNLITIIGDNDRLKSLAVDIVNHYEKRVYEKATVNGKAMIVCMKREIAFDLYKEIIALRPQWNEPLISLNKNEGNKDSTPVPFINLVMTNSKDDKPEMYNKLKETDKDEMDKLFKDDNSNFKIAIVVDMWLTGFDCPSLDTMYIDKPLQEHTLIQTISRVNRVYPQKEKGLIVDYFGLKTKMNQALKKFNTKDKDIFEGIEASVKIVKDQLDLLNVMFRNFNNFDYLNGNPLQRLNNLKLAVEYVQVTEEFETRFMANVKRMKSAYNLCLSSDYFTETDIDLIYFYGAVRSVLFKMVKGDAPDISQMNEKVSKLIHEAIISDGVEEIFSNDKEITTREIDLFDPTFLQKINNMPNTNTKVKILTRLVNDAIESYKKVNKIKGLEFNERLKKLIETYNERHSEKMYAEEVLSSVAGALADLLMDIDVDRNSFNKLGIDFEEKAFFDILENIAKRFEFYDKYINDYGVQHLIDLAKEIKKVVDSNSKYTDWSKKTDILASLKVDIILKLEEFKYPPLTKDDVYKEIFEQAENFKKYSNT